MNKLLKPSDVKGDTAYDNILRAWLGHKIESLPANEANILSRWQDVDRLYKKGELVLAAGDKPEHTKRFTWRAIVEWLVERHDISVRQAYEDIANAKRFFLFAEGRLDVEYARGAAIEQGEMMQWAAFDSGDFAGAAIFFKELNKIRGLHEQSSDLPDYTDFQPPKFILTSDPTELGFEKLENQEEIVARILNEKRKDFLNDEAEEAEVVE